MTANSKQIRRCDRCRWWERNGDPETTGECRRDTPDWYLPSGTNDECRGLWATTREDDWCGKFSADVDMQQDLVNAIRTADSAETVKISNAGADAWGGKPGNL